MSADLVRAEPLVTNPSPSDPTHWEWRASDESFIRARIMHAGPSSANRGGFRGNDPYPRYLWHVWTKDGTRHEFAEDLWWCWNYCAGGEGDYAYVESYGWRLSRIVDTHGNVINYAYGRLSSQRETCFHVRGTVDLDCWPIEITWGGNLNTGAADRYRVEFVSIPRESDTLFDYASNQCGGVNGAPRQTRRLLALKVWSRPADSWLLVRQYNFESDYSLYSDVRIRRADGTYGRDTTYPKLTLNAVTKVASDGATSLPPLKFSYLTGDGGPGEYAVGGWQRLSQVDNGQGGIMRLTYENIGAAMGRTAPKTTTVGSCNEINYFIDGLIV